VIKLTKDEKAAIIFLIAILLIGTVILYSKKTSPTLHQFFELTDAGMSKSQKVNINKASQAELMKLKNIGPVTAERIISYREDNGVFRHKEDIKDVKGIGDKTYEKIKEQITIQ